jgi:hypothetical protein
MEKNKLSVSEKSEDMSALIELYPCASQQNIDNYLSFLSGKIDENNTVEANVSMHFSSQNGIVVREKMVLQ